MSYSPLALNINRRTAHYFEIYNKNHKRFCQRFVDTIILNHHERILNLSTKYNIDGTMFHYGTVDTDIFLWKIRDVLDRFMEWPTVKQAIMSSEITKALEDFFIELNKENQYLSKVFQ